MQDVANKGVFYTAFDSHYYLSDWTPLIQDARVFVVGGAFPSVPGHYILPMHEGNCDVYRGSDGYLKIYMITSSSGISYDHDWVAIDDAEVRIDYGWYAHISHDTPASCLKIVRQKVP